MKNLIIFSLCMTLFMQCSSNNMNLPTEDDGNYFVLNKNDITDKAQHLEHYEFFSKYITGLNNYIFKGIDKVQSTAMDGGGYFIGLKADPPESPIGYDIEFFDTQIIDAPRTTSYCSGATYSAYIEAMNFISQDINLSKPDSARMESIRMQEIDGCRREDHVKLWGKWNADGFGSHFALVQYTGMGKEVSPSQARPGDFANISWKSGNGHSVVFLSWVKDDEGKKYMLYWSSQKGTNGLGDQLVSIDRIKNVKIVRLTNPEAIRSFDVNNENINRQIPGDDIIF